ncbi:hypothetical protein BL250_04740 [Erwinia sp. OLTSP20]|uniref:beta strand repeat-containing protein n=1 Tax=unclassified Erwinia TaxID=2622719 RepID=UPI000C1747D1|nr:MULTISPECIES: invasin domain 3-containing protein [unclassified Erwinia]PIJ52273.1 hypothetical protein BV501_00715 [Erwinia sp. OAMSP11]PIJ83645.1 hypothetical protein BLD46_09275 [Erwinia sp. OLMTSP26]PIJ84280.1 hypothetical protein BLD47_02760 [Erwinia sp. OLCASP19]PIJ88745.1 hypothetical protein BLD49_01070 [Erwinia sp. OLMDSP33]PIJ90341.1 hypothetical protein BL249_13360 [Erwinia sp. OLFS4]
MTELTLRAMDANNNPMRRLAKNNLLSFHIADSSGAVPAHVTISGVPTETEAGVYTVSLTGTTAGEYTVTPEINGKAMSVTPARVTLNAGAPDDTNANGKSTIIITPPNIAADGDEQSTLTVFVADAYGNGVPKLESSLVAAVKNAAGATVTAPEVTVMPAQASNTQGEYTFTLTGEKAGHYTVSVSHGAGQVLSLEGVNTVTLNPGTTPSDANGTSEFVVTPSVITTDASEQGHEATLTFTARDGKGNAINGDLTGNLTFKLKDAATNTDVNTTGYTLSAVTKVAGKDNEYTATLRGTKAGAYKVVPVFNSQELTGAAQPLEMTAAKASDVTTSDFNIEGSPIAADGTATATLIFTAKDVNDNGIGDLVDRNALAFTVTDSNGTVMGSPEVTVTDVAMTGSVGSGRYTASLKGTKAGDYTVTPVDAGTPLTAKGKPVTLQAGAPSQGNGASSIIPNPTSIEANDTDKSRLNLELKDAKGNVLSGKASKLNVLVTRNSAPVTGVTFDGFTETTTAGTYQGQLHGTSAGAVSVQVTYDGGNIQNLKTDVTLRPGAIDPSPASGTSFTIADPGIKSGATTTATFVAHDAKGNAIVDLGSRLSFVSANNQMVSVGQITYANGKYTATLNGLLATPVAGIAVHPEIDSTAVGTLSQSLVVTAGDPDYTSGRSGLVTDKPSAVADGTERITLTLTLKDALNNPLTSADAGALAGTLSPTTGASFSGFTATGAGTGVYTGTLTATAAGVYTFTPTRNGAAMNASLVKNMTFVAASPDATRSSALTFVGDGASTTVIAGSTATLSFTAKDVNNNPIETLDATTLAFVPDNTANVDIGPLTRATGGIYTAVVTGKLAGATTFHVTYKGSQLGTSTARLTVNPGTPVGGSGKSVFSKSMPSDVLADNVQAQTYTLVLKDVYGNIITGASTSDLAPGFSDSASTDTFSGFTEMSQTPGTYTATLKTTKPRTVNVTAKYKSNTITGLSVLSTTFVSAAPDATMSSSLTIDGSTSATVIAGGTATLSFTAKDANNNPIETLNASTLAFVADNAANVDIAALSYTSGGTYKAVVTGKLAGVTAFHVTYKGSQLGTSTAALTVNPGTPVGGVGKSVFTGTVASTVLADGVEEQSYELVLKDGYGNLITGVPASNLTPGFSASVSADTFSGFTEEVQTPGEYKATLKTTKARTVVVTPQYKGASIPNLTSTVSTTFVAGPPDASKSTVPSALSIKEEATVTGVTWVLKDRFDNLVTDSSKVDIAVKGTGTSRFDIANKSLDATTGHYTADISGVAHGTPNGLALLYGTAEITSFPVVMVTVEKTLHVNDDGTYNGSSGITMPWEGALNYCKDKRLPTRAEALALADSGYFDGITKASPGEEGAEGMFTVWTSDSSDGEYGIISTAIPVTDSSRWSASFDDENIYHSVLCVAK